MFWRPSFNHFYVQSPCNPLIEDWTEIVYIIDEGDIPSVQFKMSLSGPKSIRKVDGLSLDFYVPALTPRLSNTETSLQLSENITPFAVTGSLQVKVMLRPTVSRPVCYGIKHPSRAQDQIFYYCQTVAGLLMWGAISDERTGLFKITAGPHQRSHSRVRVLRDSWPHFTVTDLRFPQTGRPGPRIYIPQEQVGPVIPPDTGFPFVASYYGQGYGGGIRIHLHAWSASLQS
jgi:hypothetical protein